VDAPLTTMDAVPLVALAGTLSWTDTVKVDVPGDPPTVPLIIPAEESESPVGNDPEAIAQLLYGVVPPDAQPTIFCE
jgi:hypothetical protein